MPPQLKKPIQDDEENKKGARLSRSLNIIINGDYEILVQVVEVHWITTTTL